MSSAELPSSLPKKSSAATSEARDVAKDGGFRPQGNYTNDDQAFSIYRHMVSKHGREDHLDLLDKDSNKE